MKLAMKINDGQKVWVCFKTLSEKEVEEFEKWSLSISCDTLSYFKMPLFAISRGDLCYDFGRLEGQEDKEATPMPWDEAKLPAFN